jgi:hypothetical protein
MEKFTTQSTSFYSQKVIEPIIIDEKKRTRCIFIADINDRKLLEGETVSGTIIHQRKRENDEWEDISEFKLSELKAGEGVKLHFSSAQTKRFFDGLKKLYIVSKEGVQLGKNEYFVAERDRIIEVPADRIDFIKELLNRNFGIEVWNQLVSDKPDLATRLSYSRIQEQRQTALNEFESNLTINKEEKYWQDFFNSNTWLFGYGLKYVFLNILQREASYGGRNYSGKGEEKGDFLCITSANVRFTVLVEIKKPDTALFALEKGQPKYYRNGACQLSNEFTGALSQLQINCSTWERDARKPENYEQLLPDKIYTENPKGILIIGNTAQFESNNDARRTFEEFRTHIHGIDIITFDELLERARFIVANTHNNEQVQEEEFPRTIFHFKDYYE